LRIPIGTALGIEGGNKAGFAALHMSACGTNAKC
jgi:hypothetical protein